MRTEGQILQKLKQAQFRHLKRVLQKKFSGVEGVWPEGEVAKVKDDFREFVEGGDLPAIASKFPDVAALLWVLGDPEDEREAFPENCLVGKMGGVPLWAASEEEAKIARELIGRVVEEATRPKPEPNKVVVIEPYKLSPSILETYDAPPPPQPLPTRPPEAVVEEDPDTVGPEIGEEFFVPEAPAPAPLVERTEKKGFFQRLFG